MQELAIDGFETNTESFVVKVRVDEAVEKGCARQWQGAITHIPSGATFQFSSLHELVNVVIPFLKAHGVSFNKPKPGARE